MTTQYTTILKLALPVQGELSGTWGDVVNNNITQMVEQAVAGKAVVNTWTGNSHTLTTADGTTSESRCAILELTDSGTALTGAGTVVCPTNTKLYIVDNNTAEIITVQTAAGTGVAVPVGKTMLVYCDGTNVVEGVTHANSLSLGTSTVTADKILDEDNMASDSATAIATQQSIKAYVDSQVGSFDTLAEVLAQGNTTGGTDIAVGTGDDITFADSSKAIFGDGSDLQIYHTGTYSLIADTSGTGPLRVVTNTFQLNNAADTQNMINAAEGGAVNLYHAGNAKLATSASGISVTGTVTADGLTVDGVGEIELNDTTVYSGSAASVGQLNLKNLDTTTAYTPAVLGFTARGTTTTASVWQMGNAGLNSAYAESDFFIKNRTAASNYAQRFLIEGNGDVSFYEDTGTTPKFFWDSSAESLGIGTSSPSRALSVFGDTAGVISITSNSTDGISSLSFGDTADDNAGRVNYLNASDEMLFYTATAERMRINSSGNVGIGTSSPALAGGGTGLHINATSYPELKFTNSTTGAGAGDGSLLQSSGNNFSIQNREAGSITFSTSNTVRAALDASGNLLVGTTSVGIGDAGIELRADGQITGTRDGDYAALLNRLTSDGDIIDFRKDGTTVGSIGTIFDDLYIGTGDTNIRFDATNDAITPRGSGGSARDAAVDLGSSSVRFKDLHLSSSIRWYSGATQKAYLQYSSGDSSVVNYAASGVGYTFYAGGARSVDIDASGKVGIGTSAPAYLLQLEDSNGADLALSNSTVSPSAGDYLGRIYALDSGDNFFAGINMFYHDADDGEIRFRVKTAGTNTDVMTLVDGSVGIGTSTPASMVGGTADTAILTVGGGDGSLVTGDRVGAISFKSDDATYKNHFADGICGEITSIVESSSGSTYGLAFSTGNAATADRGERLRIDASGNVRIGVGSSTAITGLTQTNLIVGSGTGGEIVAYRDDNAGVEGDFVGAFLFGNDDNSGAEDHFAGMYGKIVGTAGNSMSLNFASGLGNYENDTPQMVLDASGNLLVGVTSTTLTGGSLTLPNSGIIAFHDAGGNARNVLQFVSGNIKHGAAGSGVTTQSFYTSNSLASTIDASGNLLFSGATSNTTVLSMDTASGSDNKQLSLAGGGADSDGRGSRIRLFGNNHASLAGDTDISTGNVAGAQMDLRAKSHIALSTNSELAVTIDSSQNLLVGRTNTSLGNTGHLIAPSGFVYHERDGGDSVMYLNRLTSDGDIARFYKDSLPVGSIGVKQSDAATGDGELFVASGNTGLFFDDLASPSNYIRPCNASGGLRDNIVDLGKSDSRFKDLYLSGGINNGTNAIAFSGGAFAGDGSANDAAIDLGRTNRRFQNLYLSGGVYLGGIGAANKLEDYEEGIWDPEIYYQNATDQGNATDVTQTGYYTKIGRVVTLNFRLIWNITGSPAADNIGVKNLPFTGMGDTFSSAGTGFPINNNTTINTLLLGKPASGGSLTICESGDMVGNLGNQFGSGNNKEIRGTLTYFTSQ